MTKGCSLHKPRGVQLSLHLSASQILYMKRNVIGLNPESGLGKRKYDHINVMWAWPTCCVPLSTDPRAPVPMNNLANYRLRQIYIYMYVHTCTVVGLCSCLCPRRPLDRI